MGLTAHSISTNILVAVRSGIAIRAPGLRSRLRIQASAATPAAPFRRDRQEGKRMTGGFGATKAGRALTNATSAAALAALVSCGGGSVGTDLDSGVNKTYLSVDASDAEGDSLQY